MTYTILDEDRKAMGEKRNYNLAILKVKEDYDSFKLLQEEGLEVDGQKFTFDFFRWRL